MGGDEQEGLGIEVGQDAVENDLAGGRVHPGNRLVQEIDLGTAGHGQRDPQLLPHALAHLLERAVLRQLEVTDQLTCLVLIEVGEEPRKLVSGC